MFGRSLKKYRQTAIQYIDDCIAELLPKYVTMISSRVFDLDDECDDIRELYCYDIYSLSLDKMQNFVDQETSDRIGYLRYKAKNANDKTNMETIGSAYLYMLNALTGKKANNDEMMQANRLTVNFIAYFKQIVRQATLAACEVQEEDKDSPDTITLQKATAKLYYTSKYSLEDSITEKQLDELLYSSKIDQAEYDYLLEQRQNLEMSLQKSKEIFTDMMQNSDHTHPSTCIEERDSSHTDNLNYIMSRAFISKEIGFTNSLVDSDFINTSEIGYYPLFSIIHGITCFYIYLYFTKESPFLNWGDSIARDVLSHAGIEKDNCDALLKLSDDVYYNLLDLAEQLESNGIPYNSEQTFTACAGIALNRELGYDEQNQFIDFQITRLFSELESVKESKTEDMEEIEKS